MKVNLDNPGAYVLAISGGVDSMVLLELLTKKYASKDNYQLIVAHLDHGIRPDSAKDLELVKSNAKRLGLKFVAKSVNLGEHANEALAREVRYQFLNKVKTDLKAKAIVTAHHQDDVIETAIINLIRGTNRKGLSSLRSQPDLIRPLLNYPKLELINYARTHNLVWHEDQTNHDTSYLRNYVRHQLVAKLDPSARNQLLQLINKLGKVNLELDELLNKLIKQQPEVNQLDRRWFNHLEHKQAREVLAGWLRTNDVRDFNAQTLERLVVAAKVSPSGKHYPIIKRRQLTVNNTNLALTSPER